MTACAPPPPDDAAWWDATVTRDAVLHQLRLQSGDVDDSRLSVLIPAAGYAINTYLDCVDAPAGPPPNPLLQAALELATIKLYGRQEPVASIEFATSDLLADVRWMLAPFKQRIGVA